MKSKFAERNLSVCLMLILGLLVCLRAVNGIFLYPLLLVSLFAFAFAPFKVCLPLLYFLLPSANIIKFQPDQISLFTIIFFVFVLRALLEKGRFDRLFLLGMITFCIYSIVFSGFGKIITIVSMACGLAMIHEVCRNDEYDLEEVIYAFSIGIIISCALSLLKDSLPIINSFVVIETQKIDNQEYVERFAALNSNPNYFTMDVSIALSCLVSIMGTKRVIPFQAILFLLLSFFGVMSVSKSFLIVWALLLLILVYFGISKGGTMFLKFLLMLVIMVVFIYFFARESIDTYIFRLTADAGGDVSNITTGRTDIWKSYLKVIIAGEKNLFFGKGLGEILKKATHNTYLEVLYCMGIVGSAVYLFALKMSVSIKIFPKNIIYYIPLLILLIRLLGISMFTHDSLCYYLAIICLLIKSGYRADKINGIQSVG